jgi:glutathione S-transferase
MVKLYYTPTSCGASSFICAFLKRLTFDCEVVDLATHTTESGVDFYTINPKGNVPALVLDDGTLLNENIACLEYIADQESNIDLAPKNGSNERYEVRQILSFLASELHATIGLFFNPMMSDPVIRDFAKSLFDKKMKYLQKHIIKDNDYVYGNDFTIVDAYLHIILSWTGYVNIDLSEYQIAERYYKNIKDLPFIKLARQRMASIPSTTY